jgi:plastocyanin
MKWNITHAKHGLLVLASFLLVCPSALAKGESGGDEVVVTIDSFQFKPKKITIKKGQSVSFTNHDAAPHTVSPAEGAKFTGTGRLLKGETKSVQFDEVGTQNYICDFHPSMKGTVNVTEK